MGRAEVLGTIKDAEDDAEKIRATADEKAKSLLAGIRKQIAAGKSFAELAKANSEGPAASKGGKLGVFERGQMLPVLEKIVFALKVTVHLVGRDVQHPLHAELQGDLADRRRALAVGDDESGRVGDRPVHVALGGEVDDGVFKTTLEKLPFS